MSMAVAKKAVKDWTNRDHRKQWNSLSGLRLARALINGPSDIKTKEQLKLIRNQDYTQDTIT
jgi:hypothetical protein